MTVSSCLGGFVEGATVTVSQDGTTVGTCTTDAAGQCCVDVSSSGTYNVRVEKASYYGSNRNVSVTCPGVTEVDLVMVATTAGWKPLIKGCNGLPLEGATITVNDGTYVTDSTGYPSVGGIALPSGGPFPYTIAKSPRFDDATGDATSFPGNPCFYLPTEITLSPANGYSCSQLCCADPFANTLYITSPVGTIAVTNPGGAPSWQGCDYFSNGNVDDCAGGVHTANVPYAAVCIPPQIVFYYGIRAFSTTKYEGGTWSTCHTTVSWTCNNPGFTVLDNTPLTGGPGSCDCDAHTFEQTLSGLLFQGSIFNGTSTGSE